MQADLDRLLRQVTLVTLAIAIALGWSLFQVAQGLADLVAGLATHYPEGSALAADSLVAGAVEVAFVLLVALLPVRNGFIGRSAERNS